VDVPLITREPTGVPISLALPNQAVINFFSQKHNYASSSLTVWINF